MGFLGLVWPKYGYGQVVYNIDLPIDEKLPIIYER